MDTSEQYIEMCEKADEIQKNHLWDEGDFYYAHNFGEEPYPMCSSCFSEEKFPLQSLIWLPRQDQLVEMVGQLAGGRFAVVELLASLDGFCSDTWEGAPIYPEYVLQFRSMEQLWLAFVMKEKYGKVWSGEEWLTSK